MLPRTRSIRLLASAIAAGPLDYLPAMTARAEPLLGDPRKARWLAPLLKILYLEFGERPRPPVHELADRIASHPAFAKAWAAGKVAISPAELDFLMAPARDWKVPEITTPDDLAAALRLHADDLGWLVSRGRVEHYTHRWHPKPKSGRFRLIEIPKPLLKHAQRRVLRLILDAVPPHEAAKGFRAGCSVRDFVEPHAGRTVLIRFDLEDFFPSISAARVLRVFLTAGYPEPVARLLTRLGTRAAPPAVLAEKPLPWAECRRLATPHLPQGAPTSPALANLCAFRLDCRLAGLAEACGADYTRYADDLLFSGGAEFARRAERFAAHVGAIVIEEGFHANHRKTRVMRQGGRQHAAGIVLNEKPNFDRREYDRLKAILTNCARHGPASQNREGLPDFAAHLRGRLSWIRFVNPAKEEKLRAIFERIDWH